MEAGKYDLKVSLQSNMSVRLNMKFTVVDTVPLHVLADRAATRVQNKG